MSTSLAVTSPSSLQVKHDTAESRSGPVMSTCSGECWSVRVHRKLFLKCIYIYLFITSSYIVTIEGQACFVLLHSSASNVSIKTAQVWTRCINPVHDISVWCVVHNMADTGTTWWDSTTAHHATATES